MRPIQKYTYLLLITLLPTLFLWLPFFLNLKSVWGIPLPMQGMATIVSNYDGPLFIVVAKSLYDTAKIAEFPLTLPAIYYAAHYPMYPLLIKAFAVILGFPYAMLFVTLATSVFAVYSFHKLAADLVKKENVMWMTFIFALFPARWLIVRSVGSAEPLFLGAVISSLYFFRKEKYFWAGLWGAVAVLTKSPGILLFISYFLTILLPSLKKAALTTFHKWFGSLKLPKLLPLLLIPGALFVLFYFYGIRYGDFYAYFNSGDNIHVFFPPFQVFNYSQPWVGTFKLEEVIYIYLFTLLGIVKLFKLKEHVLATFVIVFFTSIIFVSHRDIARYALPMAPFIILAFHQYLSKKEFRIIFMLLLLPIYLFSIAYLSQNFMPIGDWRPFL